MSNFLANKTVLLPYDFSEASNAAVDEAFGMFDDTTKVFVIHVLMPYTNVSLDGHILTDFSNDIEEERRTTAMKAMEEQIKDPLNRTFRNVRFGDPGSEIVHFANEINADFIVMPSHGRTGISRLLLGSVAERVLRLAECPVLVLRHPKTEKAKE